MVTIFDSSGFDYEFRLVERDGDGFLGWELGVSRRARGVLLGCGGEDSHDCESFVLCVGDGVRGHALGGLDELGAG